MTGPLHYTNGPRNRWPAPSSRAHLGLRAQATRGGQWLPRRGKVRTPTHGAWEGGERPSGRGGGGGVVPGGLDGAQSDPLPCRGQS